MDDLRWVMFDWKFWSVLQMHNPHSHSFHQTTSWRAALSFKFSPESESPDENQKLPQFLSRILPPLPG